MRSMMSRPATALALAVLFASPNGFAPGAAAAEPPANLNGTLVVAEDVPPQTFDPTQSSQIRTWYAWQLVYEGLVLADLAGTIRPVLASGWTTSADRLTFDVTLREGATFSDGSPVSADDVVFSFQRLATSGLPYAKDRFATLKAVTKVDDRKVRFELSRADVGFLLNLGSPFLVGSAILSQKWTQGHDPKVQMMGTGPFTVISYDPNRQLQLQRNDQYWNKTAAAKVAKLTIRYMPEQSAQIAGLKSGQIDLMFPSAESALQLGRDPTVKTVEVNSTNTLRLNVNTGIAPFSNVDVRRALSLAFDRDEMVKGALLGAGVASAQVPPAYAWAVKPADLKYQRHDPAEARRLLAQAGYPNGLDITLNHLAGYATYLDRFAELLKSQMAAAGIRVTIEANQNAVWLDKQNKANYEIMDNEYAFQADPLFYLMPRPGRQGPTPPEMTALIEKAAASSIEDYPPQLQALQRMQDDLVFPDITVVARNAWVSHTAKVLTATPDPTLSRSFLAAVTVR
jgi:peptide/nickel transport system substrate-binding protein